MAETTTAGRKTGVGGAFPQTRWTLVLQAASDDEADSHDALEEICRAYWRPIRDYLRVAGNKAEDANDLTQEFFAQLISRGTLLQAQRERGRLRSFLLASLKQFLAGHFRKRNALKRGGEAKVISLDELDDESEPPRAMIDAASPDSLFERSWALALTERARQRLEKNYAARGRGNMFAEFQAFLSWDTANEAYAETAARLQMPETNLRSQVYRLRRQYREALEEEVLETVESPEEAKAEMEHLLATLRGG
jgi:RNA polymerase sigma factor (sigma-70 family)